MYSHIYEDESVVQFLQKRNLIAQYKKAKHNILSGNFSGNKLQLRKPKSDKIYYFRINKQFRAFAEKRGDDLVVFHIDNHS